jgi:hypothetical protein
MRWCILASVAALTLGVSAGPASGDPWFKTDTHVHSAVSGDATDDIGIISKAAKDRGYDALMLTDHTATSNNEIGGVVANNVTLDEDDFQNWTSRSFGTLTSFVDEESTSTVNTGAKSLHLASTAGAGAYGEQFRWYKRGANLRTGDSILTFSVYPTQIDAGSGLYVSLSLGGDPTITSRPPQGYTTNDGVIHPGKTNVLIWQLGNPRTPSSAPDNRVTTHQLNYTLNQWNTYSINVSQAIRNEIPAAEMPMDLNAITQLKMAAGGQGGGAEGLFDTYRLKAQSPIASGDEFVYRNTHVADFNTPNFTIFPSQEVGWNRHAMRFNYGITDPSQYTIYKQGILSIVPTQQTGYPVQLNHPGLPGGVTQQEAIDTFGEGADLMEVAERSDEEGYIKNVMVDAWDGVLEQGVQLLGMWTSDMHRVERLGPATYIEAPTRGFDDLMQSAYEGRTYLAPNDFTGRAILNLDGGPDPYAARYPTYVSPSQNLANARFKISTGITTGSKVIWTSNGQQIAVDNVNGPAYDATKSIPLGGPFTYVRAELRNANGVRMAMSQPIFFTDAPGLLPAGMNYNVTRVTTPTGNGYTKLATQGITSSNWDAPSHTLSLGLTNPDGSLDAIRLSTGGLAPAAVTVDGTAVQPAASAAAFNAATVSRWWFDPATRVLLVKAKQSSGTATVEATFTDGGDTAAPAAPAGLTAHAHGAERIELQWNASAASDLRGYTVYRDGAPIAIVPAGTTTFTDQPLAAGTHFSYTVDAFDVSENHSPLSNQAGATTDVVTISTFEPVADSYVDSSRPTARFGTADILRIDGSPVIRTYLRFDVSGLQGTIETATLRMFNNSKSNGHDIHSATNTWAESTIDFNTAPAPSDTLFGSSNGGEAGEWSTADVTPLVTGDGTITAELDTVGTAGINYSSRDGANPPQLVVETSVPSNDPPTATDVSIATPVDTQAQWTPAANDPDGDPLTCEIVSQPASGSATVAPDCSSGTYTPATGFNGSASFTYRAIDSHGVSSGTATVSVAVSQRPTAAPASFTTDEDAAGHWDPAANDLDGDGLTCQIASPPTHGTATVAGDCSGGTYTPTGDFNGSDSFSYRAVDSHGVASGAATVSATVTPVNDAPTAAARSLTTTEDVQGSWTPSVSDVDDVALTCEIVSQPAHGTAAVASDCSGGTYTPAENYAGPSDSFTYRAVDSHSAQSNSATVSATITAVNDPPAAADRSLTTDEDSPGSWTPSISEPDGDATTCEIVSQPAHGTATVASNCSGGTYTPAANYSGADSFTYRAIDGHSAQSNDATVGITVSAKNDPPAASDRSFSTQEDTQSGWSPSVSDIDGDAISCQIVSPPAHGSATVAADCSGGTYTPAPDYSGADSFSYRATDTSDVHSSPAGVSVSVSGVNDAPTASARSLTTAEDAPAAWTPAVADADGDALSCELVAQPAHGSATVAPDCSGGTYTPAQGYSGDDRFSYRAFDPSGAASGAADVNATVTVTPLFEDGFETGTLAAWSTSRGLTVQTAFANTGTFAARGHSTGAGVNWAKRALPSAYSELAYRVHFRAERPSPTGSPTIMRLRTAGDRALASLHLSAARKLSLRNDLMGTSHSSGTSVALGRWYELELHAFVNGAGSTLEVRLDGHKLEDISTTATDLGTNGIGVLQIGENTSGPTYDFRYDDVSAKRTLVGSGGTAALRAAPRCTSRSGVRLSGLKRQRVGSTGTVLVGARTKSTCRLAAKAIARDARGRRLASSRQLKTVLPSGHAGSLGLRFTASGRRRIKQALAHRAVYVVISAGPSAHPLARRRVLVSR